MTNYKKTPQTPLNRIKKKKNKQTNTLSKIHKHSRSSVKFDIAPCPKVLAIYYQEEILTLGVHF